MGATATIVIILGLIVATMILVLCELLTPSFGILTFLALCTLVGAIWLAFTLSPAVGGLVLAGMVVGIPIYVYFLLKYMQRSRFGRKLFLERAEEKAGSGTPQVDRNAALPGKTGVTETTLRPSGAVRIEGQRIIARAETGFIGPGQTVRVIRAVGSDVIVRQVTETGAG